MAKRKLEVEIIGDAASLVKALGKAGSASDKFAKQAHGASTRVGSGFAGMAKRAVGMAAAVGGAYASIAGAKKAISVTEDLAKTTLSLHKNLGLSVHAASQWAAVAKSRDIDSKQLNQSFGTLAKNSVAAAEGHKKAQAALNALGNTQADAKKRMELLSKGSGAQADAFLKLGISQKDLKAGSKDFNGLLGKVSDGFGKMHAGTEKTALGMKLFGKGWQTVLPVLRGGSKAMNEQLALADKYGVTFKGKTVKSVQDLVAAQRESKFATMGLQVAFATQLAPAITKGINAVSGFIAGIRNGTGAGGKFGSILGTIGKYAKIAFDAIKGGVQAVVPALVSGFNRAKSAVTSWVHDNSAQIKQVLQAFKNVAHGVGVVLGAGFRAARDMVKAILPGITQVVKGAFKVISGVVQVFSSLLTGDFGGAWRGVKKITSGAVQALGGIIRAGIGAVKEAVGKVASGMVSAMRAGVGAFFRIGLDMLAGLAHGIASAAKSVYDAAKGVVKGAVDGVKGFLGIKSPSRLFHGFGWAIGEGLANGVKASKGMVRAGMASGLLFPIQAAIAKLTAERDKFQASMDAWDRKRERQGLVRDLSSARKHPASGSSSGGSASGGSGGSGGMDWAASMVGHFKESAGNNRGPELDRLQRTFGTQAAAWCAEFATTAVVKAGASKSLLTAGVANIRGWAGQGTHGLKKGVSKTAHVGDLMMFGNNHVGVVESVNRKRGTVGTIEGNTGAGMVARRTHGIGDGDYASPIYRAAAAKAKASGKKGGDGGSISDALKALKEFDRETARAKKLSAIDVKIAGLQQLQTYTDALAGIKDKLKDLAKQAAATWREAQEKAINATHDQTVKDLGNSADAVELKSLQATDAAEEDAKTVSGLNDDLAAAIKAQDTKAQKDAQDAIAAYKRQKREEELQLNLENATTAADTTRDTALAALDQQETDYAASLQTQLDALTGNLDARTTTYKDWAKGVNKILNVYGLGVDVSSDEEAAITTGPGGAKKPKPSGNSSAWGHHLPGRAAGGPVHTGQSYWVGERGPEIFTPRTSGAITSAHESKGGGSTVLITGPVTMGSQRDAEKLAHTLAFRLRHG